MTIIQFFESMEKKSTVSDDEKDRQREKERIRVIYHNWKTRVVNTRVPEAEFADRMLKSLNRLAAEIQNNPKHKELSDAALDAIDYSLAQTAAFQTFLAQTILVEAHCENKLTINNVVSDCLWEGRFRIDRKTYDDGTAEYACPKCAKKITCDQMKVFVKSRSSAPE